MVFQAWSRSAVAPAESAGPSRQEARMLPARVAWRAQHEPVSQGARGGAPPRPALLACALACDAPDARIDILGTEKKLYSQGNEELIIRDFFQDMEGGFFLDIGCAWPEHNSTTYYLEKHLGWTGIGVDALPSYASEWQKKRPNAKFLNYAVTNRSGGTITFYQHAWTGVSSLIEEQAAQFGGKEKLTPIQVPAITLDDLLEAQGVTKIDHLTMDIEGAEMQALEGFDIERFAPKLVCIEAHTNKEAGEEELMRYFSAHGYERIERYVPHDIANWYFTPRTGS
jgi:FkbM family methyltransferase